MFWPERYLKQGCFQLSAWSSCSSLKITQWSLQYKVREPVLMQVAKVLIEILAPSLLTY